jgi:hypothetical protein
MLQMGENHSWLGRWNLLKPFDKLDEYDEIRRIAIGFT